VSLKHFGMMQLFGRCFHNSWLHYTQSCSYPDVESKRAIYPAHVIKKRTLSIPLKWELHKLSF